MTVGSSSVDIAQITVDRLADELTRGARLIDVREPDEFAQAHIPGAVLIPLATVPDHIDDFRADGPTYVVCRSGGRSQRACEFVAAHGADVVNVAGGTLAWIEGGHAVDQGAA